METKANYVIVGIFTIVAIIAAFAFVYWTAAIGDRGETATLRVRIPGSASGLGRGSAVLFNGVKVGDVRRVFIDVDNPAVAIADTEIDKLTPITKSTQADIGLAGLTGQANIELKGADKKEPNLLDEAEAAGKVAEITANPSAVTNLLQTAQDIFKRADHVLSELEGFTQEARGPLTQTIANAKTFSDALARNADGVDKFLASVSSLSEELAGVSGKLDGTLKAAENILNSVDPKKIETIVGNVDTFTKNLSETSNKFDQVIRDVDSTVLSVKDFTQQTKQTLAKVDGVVDSVGRVVGSVDPATVKTALANIGDASGDAKAAAADIAKFTSKIGERTNDIDHMISDARQLASRLNAASVRVDGILVKVDTLLGSDQVNGVVADAGATLRSFRQVADTLNARLGTILDNLDDLLGSGQAQGVMTDASATLKSFKQVADTLNSRLGVIIDNVARFSGPGLQDVNALVQDTRRSINRIQEAVTDLERNPQRILSGGDGTVRQYDGRARR